MAAKLIRYRNAAFHLQQGRCYYCDLPMWQGKPHKYMASHRLTHPEALNLQCTAEHLIPRRDGGTDEARNIVAACWWCNNRRHKGPAKSLSSILFGAHVRRRMAHVRWHHSSILAKLMPEKFGLRPRISSASLPVAASRSLSSSTPPAQRPAHPVRT